MQLTQAAIMGALQGLTEFLPVSSSGHIVLSSAIYKILTGADFAVVGQEEIFFDILIHLATLFAVLIYFYKDIKAIFFGFIRALFARDFDNFNFKYGLFVIFATFMTCIIGYLIKDFAHEMTRKPFFVSLFLMLTGLILFLSEKIGGRGEKIDFKKALLIGVAQGFAVLPGISRSGMTISAAISAGANRVEAAKFSFILSVPIIILASIIYPLLTFKPDTVENFDPAAIGVGMSVSFVVGYFCIKYFMKFLEKRNLKGFAFYCAVAGGICAAIFGFQV